MNTKQLLYAVILALPAVMTGCSTSQLASFAVDEAINTAAAFGRKLSVQKSFLTTSTLIFYPNGVPNDINTLPVLREESLKLIQENLNIQAELLIETINQEASFVSELLGKEVFLANEPVFEIKNSNKAVAYVGSSNIITVDVKVLQGIYRGVVINTVASLGDRCDLSDDVCQLEALKMVISASESYREQTSVKAIHKGSSLLSFLSASPSNMNELQRLLEEQMATSLSRLGKETMSVESARRYDDAILFLIAHELGHIVLNHYERKEQGESQYELELEADRFSAVVSTLVRNKDVKPRSRALTMIDGVGYQSSFGGPMCRVDYNHTSKGYSDFLEFGFVLAGFDLTSTDYPSVALRSNTARAITQAMMQSIGSVQKMLGECDGKPGLPDEPIDLTLEKYKARLISDITEYKEKLAERSYHQDWWKRNIQRNEDLLAEFRTLSLVYKNYIKRLN
ncbi:ImmA/IrrE family metallo-endopeptidase [Pseudoalteromonas byunsanensis]|uniref:Uncharacterized protein n=1 Tax=Pseudoalteromonas byunsanensis TaxID=327939 RepID=A0A1S1N7F3_9GAMM|nr:ImmA/IrrE family metallo-endopeptidase [Pseudoalteromonas byunsanensis]OHU95404.1 hypothetical protein BIW53_11885 [Pseudoalteromonas byunsanensis]